MRKNHSPGCPCCEVAACPEPNLLVSTRDCCGSPEPDASVSVLRVLTADPLTTDPVAGGAGTTDGTGLTSFNLPDGNYLISVSTSLYDSSNFVTIDGCESSILGFDHPLCGCIGDWPDVLTLAGLTGPVALTKLGSTWYGQEMIEAIGIVEPTDIPFEGGCGAATTGPIDLLVRYELSCGSGPFTGNIRLRALYTACYGHTVVGMPGTPPTLTPTQVYNADGSITSSGWGGGLGSDPLWNEVNVDGLISLCAIDCRQPPNLLFALDFSAFGNGLGIEELTVDDGSPSGPPVSGQITLPESIQLCVKVHGPDCPGDPGAPIVGASVSVLAVGDDPGDALEATTDGEGMACVAVHRAGLYLATVVKDGCTATGAVFVGACETEAETDITICCAYVTISISGLYADEAGTIIPLAGASVTGLTGDPLTADVGGVVGPVHVPTARMLAWPVVGDCSVRRATIRVGATTGAGGWIDQCVQVDLHCGSTETEPDIAEVTLLSDKLPDGTSRYVYSGGPSIAPLCPDHGCSHPGWSNRGRVASKLVMTFNFVDYEYEYELDDLSGTATAWHNMLPGSLVSGSIVLELDNVLLLGDDPDTVSPFGPSRRVEWYGSGTGGWTPRGAGSPYTTHFEVWHNATGTRLRLEIGGYDPSDLGGLGTVTVPTAVPESGAGLGTEQAIDLVLNHVWDPCDLTGGTGSISLPTGMDNGLGFRAGWEWAVA